MHSNGLKSQEHLCHGINSKQMDLTQSDYLKLITEEGIDVFSELIKLNMTKYYNHSLDVIKLTRTINLQRIKSFLN